MRRRLLLLVLTLVCVGFLQAGLPATLTKAGNPDLYKSLMPRAKQNLMNLPKLYRKPYQKLLKKHNDILMAFLIAYESNANLAHAVASDIESNYREIVRLLDHDGMQYSPEFFLSYVARQSVSDERIGAYRKAMLDDGLSEVLQNYPDPLERFRATTLWCVEKLQFRQTSGRDQNPLDIMQKSLIGRCEEMQILLVAATRTVGIPSRPASTPWWAHMDNNHAWAEVWLDGAWQYTGDMDSAYFPNQTWFSAMIDKTVLILAEGSLAAEADEVLISGQYDSVVNSTANYAKDRTRKIQVSVLDDNREAVDAASVTVSIMVFNWGALRSLIQLSTDANGNLSFSAGRGAFYLSVFKDGAKALQYVPSSDDSLTVLEIVLSKEELPIQEVEMMFPANEMDWQNAPDEYRSEVEHRKRIWQNNVEAFQSGILETAFEDSLSFELAKLFRGNADQFVQFYEKHRPVAAEFLTLLGSSDPKLLWQADSYLLEAMYAHWRKWQDHEHPNELYSPTSYYEELPLVTPAKDKTVSLYPAKFIQTGATDHEKIENCFKWLRKNYQIKHEKAIDGLLRLDIAEKMKYLTRYQYRFLAISVLKANGIAAEFTRVPNNILIYLDGDWRYYNVETDSFEQQKDDGQSKKLWLSVVDSNGVPVLISSEQYGITKYVEGMFYNLNTQFEHLGGGIYQAQVPISDAYLHYGFRKSDTETNYYMYPITADTDSICIIAKDYPRSWDTIDEEVLGLFSKQVLDAADCIVLGNYDQENSLRIIDKLKEAGKAYKFFGYTNQSTQYGNYSYLASWQKLVSEKPSYAFRCITLIKLKDEWKMYDGLWSTLP